MFVHISTPVPTLVPRLEVEEQYISNSRLRYHQLPIKSTPGQEEYFSNPAPLKSTICLWHHSQFNIQSYKLEIEEPVIQLLTRLLMDVLPHLANNKLKLKYKRKEET